MQGFNWVPNFCLPHPFLAHYAANAILFYHGQSVMDKLCTSVSIRLLRSSAAVNV